MAMYDSHYKLNYIKTIDLDVDLIHVTYIYTGATTGAHKITVV